MSYLTVEAQIDHGRIIVKEPEKLPETGSALLTILNAKSSLSQTERPIGLAKGKLTVAADFNDPLPEDVIRDFEGG